MNVNSGRAGGRDHSQCSHIALTGVTEEAANQQPLYIPEADTVDMRRPAGADLQEKRRGTEVHDSVVSIKNHAVQSLRTRIKSVLNI